MVAKELLVDGTFDVTGRSPQVFEARPEHLATEFVKLEIITNHVRSRESRGRLLALELISPGF